jgi:hypothetical protein
LFASSQLTRDGKLKEHVALENAKCINNLGAYYYVCKGPH